MAEYGARDSELTTRYQEAYRDAVEAERRGGTPVVHASWLQLKLGLDNYSAWRDRAITDGLPLLRPDSGATGANQQERWAAHYQSRGTEAHTQIESLGRSAEDAIQRFVLFVAMQESLFFRQLSQFTLARAAGQIRQWLRELSAEAEKLEDKWRDLSGLDERADGEIAALRAQFLREFESAVEKLLGWGRKVEEVARSVVTVAGEYDDKADPEPSFGPIAIQGMSVVAALQAPIDLFVREAQRRYDAEAPVHGLFKGLREQVGAYYAKLYQAAGGAYSEACAESADRAGQCTTDGQRADAKRFFEKASKEVEPMLSEYRTALDKFYDQFDGRFLGEVSDKTAEYLADQELFNAFWREFEDQRVPDALKQVLDDIERACGLSMDTLRPETRDKIRRYFEEKLAPHREKLRSMDSSFFRRLYDQAGMGAKLSWEKIKRLPGHRK